MKSVTSKDGLDALREAWKKVGTTRRGDTSTCGVCGCKSNLWVTAGNAMIGIKQFLVCPGKQLHPDLHEKISRKQDLLWENKLPDSTQEEIVIEIARLLTRFASIEPDIESQPNTTLHKLSTAAAVVAVAAAGPTEEHDRGAVN